MIHIYVGLPGSGKTMKLASVSLWLLKRNERYFKKTGKRRMVYSNIKFNDVVEKRYGDFIYYWKDLDQLVKSRDIDVVWQEMSGYLDSQEWEKVSMDFKWWIRLHRHYGVDIYGDTQDFPTIDVSVRRITNNVYRLVKLFGSRDKSATRPDSKVIWGLVMMFDVDPTTFGEEKQDYKYTGFRFMWISKYLTKIFDSYADIEHDIYPPLKHIHRFCPVCKEKKLIHK